MDQDRKPLPDEPPGDASEITARLMLGLLAWGALLALGAALFGVGPQGEIALNVRPLRGVIVAACVAAFVGGWWLLLRRRQ